MSNKTLAILSYVTIIGWIIALVQNNSAAEKSSLVKYHLRQGLGLAIVSIIFNVALTIIATVVPSLAILGLVGYAFLVFLIIGIINASNEVEKPLPLIGHLFEDKFAFIS
ncbi:DUF4870 domain-containing protein [Ferruginibacter sp. HRS2-29]|uniref:DUF4870 domain-containing protein n=1 Tax=Ferruginibacter sp. HRS2-29 TaxID=2487334 RepID=UPI0020CEAB0C|nr:DUF4870 domain-containing protein [Ferruginibacter sp. HRS2-29]MCP9752742.1 DUF4870 domain-containing protein [Ferruginibacter sp. HRS2-29]